MMCEYAEDCSSSFMFQCVQGQCKCVLMNGYEGDNCSRSTALTSYARIVVSINILLHLVNLMMSFLMVKAYLYEPRIRNYRRKQVIPTNEIPERERLRQIRQLEKYKNQGILLILFCFCLVSIFPKLGRMITLTLDPKREIERLLRAIFIPLRLGLLGFAQLKIGISWLEVGANGARISFLQKKLNTIKYTLFLLSLGWLTLAAVTFYSEEMSLVAQAFFQAYAIVGALSVVSGGCLLSRKMIQDGILLPVAHSIQLFAYRLTLFFSLLSGTFALIATFRGSNGWIVNTTFVFNGIFEVGYLQSFLTYLDCDGFVYLCTRRDATMLPTMGCIGNSSEC
mmetsp:Transcript_15859/g.20972  ORF Transcript_15859/g.20972 Transcript_15859/m.20972 type:complete len:338 (+) Transcript_15859:192-1205(+)